MKLLGLKGSKMGQKWSFSSFLKNQFMEHFWFFCMELQQHEGSLKLTLKYHCGKNPVLGFLGKKWPKMSFLSFLINWCIELFLFFTWSYNSRKSGKWINIFLKQSYFRFFGQKTNLISCELKLFLLDLNLLNCILTLYFAMS